MNCPQCETTMDKHPEIDRDEVISEWWVCSHCNHQEPAIN
jgi:C4-type Zn-finger protein